MAKRSSKKMPGSSPRPKPAPGTAKAPGPTTAPKARATPSRQRRGAKRGRGLSWGVGLAAVVVLVIIAVATFSGAGTSGADVTEPSRFDLPALHGKERVRLADFRGKPLVVNFFASWCTACDEELPGFAKVSEELKGKVQFVGVNSLETGDRDFMPNRHHITWWPLAEDVAGSQGSGLHDALGGGNGMPITAFYDANGKLVTVQRGAIPETALRQTIQQLYGIAT